MKMPKEILTDKEGKILPLKKPNYFVFGQGSWGKASTIKEAIRKAKSEHSKFRNFEGKKVNFSIKAIRKTNDPLAQVLERGNGFEFMSDPVMTKIVDLVTYAES